MNRPTTWSLLLAATLALGGCAHRSDGRGALPAAVQAALERAGLDATDLAVVVMPLQEGPGSTPGPRLTHQPDRAMQPASAMKVVTSAVALDRIGPNRRSYTELRTASVIDGDRLRGDLILRGGADPELGLPQLWSLMLELREAGVRRIEGDIVLDRTLFTPARADIGVPPFDESPEFPYNVIPDALQLAGNLHVLELQADAQSVKARLRPELPGVVLDNQLTVHAGASVACKDWSEQGWRVPESSVRPDGLVVVRLQGRFPAHCMQRQPLQLMERNLQAQAQLRWIWQELGGQWSGRVREAALGEYGHEPSASLAAGPSASTVTRLIARREARPWGEWLRPLNKTSDNVATRLLYLMLGVEEAARASRTGLRAPGQGHTRDWAQASVRRWFTEQGIPSDGLVMDNGSGLSRSERITPRQLALVLRAAHAQTFAPDLLMSLPVAGIDGSLRNRMTDGAARGQARLKPGTLRNAVALAGYVDDPQGRRWVMAAIINHDEAPQRGRPVLDAIANWVASGGR